MVPLATACGSAPLCSQTSNLDDHVIQPRRILVHDFAFIFSDHDGIRVAKAAPIGIVDTRLTTEGHALFQDCLVTLGDPGCFVAVESDPVAGSVPQQLLDSGLAELLEALLVNFVTHGVSL